MLDATVHAEIDASGAGIRRHVLPPSVVRTIAAQGEPEHAPVPSSQPSEADTNVRETGAKLAVADPGPGPTAGDALGVDVGSVVPGVAADGLGLDEVAAAMGVAPGAGLDVMSPLVETVALPQPPRRERLRSDMVRIFGTRGLCANSRNSWARLLLKTGESATGSVRGVRQGLICS